MAKRDIEVRTADGVVKAGLYEGGQGAKGAVLFYMDIFGPRPALDEMAERIAAAGWLVLLPDLFHRYGVYGPFDPRTAFGEAATKAEMLGMMRDTTLEMTARDTAGFLDALSAEGQAGPVGVVGYCMGGPRALTAAAAFPDRVAAAASFHGGHLATDAADSPHRRAAEMKGRIYVGSAGVDASFPPEASATLAQALREAEVDHVLENYAGMKHGWTVPDLSVFDAAGADRAMSRLLTLFEETLG